MDFLHSLRELWDRLSEWMLSFADSPYGGLALFLFAFAESSFFPLPPDVLLIALCLARPESSFFFAFLCTAGSVLGGVLGYGIGFYGGRPLLRRLFSAEKIRAVESFYDRFDAWATGIAGLTPIPYKIFTIAGGAFSINLRIFVIASVLSRGLRFFAVAGLCYVFGEPMTAFIKENLNILAIAFVVCLVLGYWLVTKFFARAAENGDAEDGTADEAPENEG